MGFLSRAVCLLMLLTLASSLSLRQEPDAGEPAFVRSAVESVPEYEQEEPLGRYSLRPTFGEIFLPLRSAVESVPTIRSSDSGFEKSFVRSSVESAPQFEDLTEDEEVIEQPPPEKYIEESPNDSEDESADAWSTAEDFSVFSVPNPENDFNPQPYRSGSPFQEIVTAEQIALELEEEDRFGQLKARPTWNDKNLNQSPKVLCYFTNWAFYRQGEGKFVPENVDPSLCTAVIYSFASLDPDHLTIREFDPWVDVENQYYKRISAIKVPVLIALGGWTDSTGDKYSRLAADEIKRNVFASSVAGFLQRNGFSGLHLDWNYPKCWQSDCKQGPASDRPNFTKLVRALRQEFNRVDKKLQLGVAISGYQEIISEAYELAELSKLADYLTVMTYDYHGAWESKTGHVSPLYGRKGDKYPQYNTDYAMQLLVKSGAAPEKLIMGIPFYGQTFTLAETRSQIVGEGSPSSGPGEPGEFTKQPGMMAYYEICQRIRKNKWQIGRDPERKSGPYAMLQNQWVGFEDPSSVEAKARYAANSGFGGVAAWTVDLDDFQNRCCSEAFPLLKSINRALGRLSSPPPSAGGNCQRPPQPVTPVAPVMTTPSEGGNGAPQEHTTWPSWKPSSLSTTTEHDHVAPVMTTPSGSSSGAPQEHTTWQSWKPSSPSTTTEHVHTSWTTTRRPTTSPFTTTTTTKSTTTSTRRPTTTTTRRTTTPLTNFESTTIPTPAVIQPVVVVTNCRAGEFLPDPNNCNAYYHCVADGTLTLQYCAGGLHWNRDNKYCDWPSSAQCKTAPKTTKAPTKTTTRPISESNRRTTTIPPTTTPPTTPRPTKPRPTAARPTTARPTTARPTTAHPTTARPVTNRPTTSRPTPRPTQRPTPRPTARPTQPDRLTTQKPVAVSPSKPAPPRPQRPKKCKDGEFWPHRSCGKYYLCVNEHLVPNDCGNDLQWNHEKKICDWPANVRCVSTKKFLRLIHSRASESDPCEGKQFVPYPGDCSRYLRCNWDRLEAADCAPGLHWNSNAAICDWPANAKCKQGGALDEGVNVIGSEENSLQPLEPMRPSDPKPPTTTTARPTTTQRPTYPTDRPQLEPLDGYYKVVCYFTNWAWYRKGLGRYTPDNINTDLCTHIVYGFAVLDYSELTLRTHDSWADLDNKFYTRVSDLKAKGVKVTLALGGWNDSQGDKYSRLVRNPAARAKFIKHAIGFIEKYGFEGLDLDWEYPVCWQTECSKGIPDEKEGFTAWVRELSEAFKPRGLLLSTAVSPSKKIIDAGYDVPVLARYFDWIAVMTYDFHGQWDKKTGHVAPLYYHPDDDFDYFNANFSLNYWIEKGAPSRKIVMGMPLYGQSFTLANSKENGLNAKAPGPGQAGEFTRAAGFLAYYEICDRIKNQGWEVIQDEQGRMGPFARKGNQWVSFDDTAMIRKKSQLVRAMNLGGGMVWALDLDDFKNRCGSGVHPLLTQIHDVLKSPPSGVEPTPGLTPSDEPQVIPESASPAPEPVETVDENEPNIETVEEILSNEEIPANIETIDNELPYDPNTEVEEEEEGSFEVEDDTNQDFKVVCYFTNWAWYRQGGGKFLPEDIDAELCTHIVYGFAVLNRDTLTIQPHDSWADKDNKFYERVTSYRAKKIKVTVAIGGWNDSAGDKYARLVRSAAARARFIKHVMEFIETYKFDGLDLDWEYPVCWQVDCSKGDAEEKEGFAALVRELSEKFKPRGLLLSTAVSPNKKVIDAGYDVPELSRHFDWIAVMTYDYHGQWDKKTGHVAPMYNHPDDDPTFNANFSINYWISQGADRRKIIMGMPMYGQSFSLAQAKDHDLNAQTYGGGEAGEATRARGFLAYYEICRYIRDKKWHVVRDPRGRMGPYAYLRDQWVSFDDAPMIRHKSEYVKAMGLGGAMIWALDLDDFKNVCNCESYPLLKTINRVLRKYKGPHPHCKLEEKSEIALLSYKDINPIPSTERTTTTQAPVIVRETTARPDYPDESPTSEDLVDIDCRGRNYIPHKRDCNKYYICQFGGLIEQRCPSGLYWNEDHCDWPQNSPCGVPDSATTTARPKPVTKPSKKPLPSPTKKPSESPTKRPTADKKPPPVKPVGDERYKVVCYFTNWAWYRPGEGKYVPEDIDENLCTHIVYGFAVLNRDALTIKTHDSWADIDNRFYERVVAYKEKGIRVTVAIGGWNDSLGDKYARLVLNPDARAKFIKSVLDFIDKYGFEGLDLDWEYPVCWQVECKKGTPQEKSGFAALVRELSEAFKPRGLLLSSAVSPSKMVIDAGYDVPTLARYFDWIAVMTYDFHGHWDKQTGHVAPLYYIDGDTYEYFNANFSMHYWIEKGTPPKKLVMGMPLYGQSFSVADTNSRGLNQRTLGPGQAGKFTRAGGFLAYYEICENVNNGGWTVVRDDEGRIGPYAYRDNQWVSYDDVAEIRRKSDFVKKLGLGGGMVWALDLDDFRGRCGCGKHPLLRTLNQELRGIPGQRANDCT